MRIVFTAVIVMLATGGTAAPVVAQTQFEPAIAPAPPPTAPNARNFGPWPVGLWRRGAACRGAGEYLRMHNGGRYEGSSDSGSWTLAGDRLTFRHRAVGANATAAMERSAAIRARVVSVKKVSPTKIMLNSAAWTRCSPDPDLYID